MHGNKTRKILIATPLYPPDIGGPSTYAKLLTDQLPGYGIETKISNFSDVKNMPKVLRHVAYLFKVMSSGKDVDIIYAQDPVSVGLPSMLAAKILRKKFFVKIVGDYAWEQGVMRFGVEELLDDFMKSHKEYKWQVKLFRHIEKTVANNAYAIITPSRYLKKIVGSWGVEDSRIHIIYNAAEDIERDIKDKPHNLIHDDFVIVSAGRLVPWKGFKSLILAVGKLRSDIPNIKLIIAGDGPDKDTLISTVNENSLEDKVFLLGDVDKRILSSYILNSDLFVLNTGYEGLSHQLLEVMTMGIPIITTSSGGNTELIKNKKTGILIEFDNVKEIIESILYLYNNPDLRKSFALTAKKEVEKFSKDKMLEETTNLLKR
jgi:glycosyltransferase involved in cell wall biosynthesis